MEPIDRVCVIFMSQMHPHCQDSWKFFGSQVNVKLTKWARAIHWISLESLQGR